jgi:vitamin-K-epoxide reductase (warfarin-sensitive)
MILVLSLIGFAIATYAVMLEKKLAHDPQYKPVCDLSDRVSCSKPIKSAYSHILYFSNATWGALYYAVVMLLALSNMPRLLLIVTAGGVLSSLVLAYLLFFRIKSFCLVCISLYVVNILLFVASLKRVGVL